MENNNNSEDHHYSNEIVEDTLIPIGEEMYNLDAARQLGSGAFGEIYLGHDIELNKEVAIKLEPTHSKHPQLLYEALTYMNLQGGVGIPKFHWCGTQGQYT